MSLRRFFRRLFIPVAQNVGSIAALLAAKTASALLFGLKPYDPATLASAIAGLSVVAALACYVPAWRASRLEPTVALRED